MSMAADGRVGGGSFSATEAAFEGFRILQKEPKTVAAWSLLMLVFSLAIVVLMVLMVGAALSGVMTPGATPADPSRALGALAAAVPFYGLVLVISVVLYGVMYGAVNRTVLQPGSGGFGHLRLGGDEFRQMGVLLLVWLALFVAYFVGAVLLVIVAGIAGAVSKIAGVLIAILGIFALIAGVFFLLVRLSLLSPMAFDRKRIAIGDAWRMTRGRFWPLLGAYLLAAVVCMVLFVIILSIVAAVAGTAGGGLLSVTRPNMTSLASYFGVVQVVNLLLSSAAYGLVFALMLGAPARAYAQLAGSNRLVEVFGPAGAVPGAVS